MSDPLTLKETAHLDRIAKVRERKRERERERELDSVYLTLS